VPDVVQVDLRRPGRRGELLKPPGNRVGMWWPAVFPAEQHAVIVVLRPEVPPLLIELLDVRRGGGFEDLQRGEPIRPGALWEGLLNVK